MMRLTPTFDVSGLPPFERHRITYVHRAGHRRKHAWTCSCGAYSMERTQRRRLRLVAFHLWMTKEDFDPFGGDDARHALGQSEPVVPQCVLTGHLYDETDTCVWCPQKAVAS